MPTLKSAHNTPAKGKIRRRVSRQIKAWKARIERELSGGQISGSSEGNSVSVYFDGDEAFEAMMQAISEAKHYVHLEMYMFHSDQIGTRFARALSAKAKEGIPVRVLYDAIGSLNSNAMIWADMRDAGVSVVEYRPVAFWRKRSGLLGRNHRKNLIIDGAVGFTGGMNIGDVWTREFHGDSSWRDTHCRVIGPAAMDLNGLFVDSWQYATEETIFHRPDSIPLTETELQSHFQDYYEHHYHAEGQSRCVVVGSRGIRTSKEIRKLFSVHLALAKKSINMTMPYFVPPKRLRKALREAAERDLSIKILLPRDSDVKIVDWLREGLYLQMLNWGIKLREYLGPVLHAKTMTVDGEIALIGSSNFDFLSVAINREVGIVVFDREIVSQLDQQWQNDLTLSERVTNDWAGLRPWWRLLAAKVGCFLLRRL